MSKLAHRFSRHGLLPSTRKKYVDILSGADRGDLLRWLNGRIHARTPLGTVLPMRAAVKHYLVAEVGYSEDEVDKLLPRARGQSARSRAALSPQQLALYHAAAEAVPSEPVRAILALLPTTGLRIGEITSLAQSNLRSNQNRLYLQFRGKRDKERLVPLTRPAQRILEAYLAQKEPGKWIFPSTWTGRPITPHGVRKWTRQIAVDHPELEGLSPHVLRHTFATMALRNGVDLKNLQALMGHENITTTSRYLHPSLADLQDSIDALE